jgi:hypothetical protein
LNASAGAEAASLAGHARRHGGDARRDYTSAL